MEAPKGWTEETDSGKMAYALHAGRFRIMMSLDALRNMASWKLYGPDGEACREGCIVKEKNLSCMDEVQEDVLETCLDYLLEQRNIYEKGFEGLRMAAGSLGLKRFPSEPWRGYGRNMDK